MVCLGSVTRRVSEVVQCVVEEIWIRGGKDFFAVERGLWFCTAREDHIMNQTCIVHTTLGESQKQTTVTSSGQLTIVPRMQAIWNTRPTLHVVFPTSILYGVMRPSSKLATPCKSWNLRMISAVWQEICSAYKRTFHIHIPHSAQGVGKRQSEVGDEKRF